MKTLSDFTPEIQAKIPEYIKRYTDGVFNGKKYNNFQLKDAEELIYWNYEKCGLKKPVVIVAENPLEAQYIFNYIIALKDIWSIPLYIQYCLKNNIELPKELTMLKTPEDSQLRSQLRSQLDSQLDSQLRSQLDSQLDSQLRSQLDSQLRSQLDSQLRSQLRSQLDSQLRSQLRSQLDSQLDSQLRSQLDSQLRSQLDSQLDSQLGSQLGSQLDSQLGSQLRSQLDSQLDSQLRSQLRSQLDSQLDSQLRSQLDSQLGKYNTDYLFTTTVYGGYWLGWYKFIKDEFKIDAEINVSLDSWNNLYEKSGIYSAIFSELVCVVSKYPKEVNRNENNDLHNSNNIAVKWGSLCPQTNFDRHFINGRNISKDLFDKISTKEFTITNFINESNEETKSVCIAMMQEKFGDEYLVNFFKEHLKETDTFVDKKPEKYLKGTSRGMNVGVYTLFKGTINNEKIAYIRCFCPSSDRMFFLGVDSKHITAKNAIASLYRIPLKLKPHIKSISRQGERYSTILTVDGKNILNSLSQKEIENLSEISGSDYFDLIHYEF